MYSTLYFKKSWSFQVQRIKYYLLKNSSAWSPHRSTINRLSLTMSSKPSFNLNKGKILASGLELEEHKKHGNDSQVIRTLGEKCSRKSDAESVKPHSEHRPQIQSW